ncbi:hypothetical protein DACRYDRAFT_76875 [Dacryopinax primogenitus]|uniref:CCR4-Not complex 3'-5'-exoribonuclease subunit Ccr4 n=1 Tax=Dacryopinax primogenitus (strain DJM 731) TaxID=1858805 RepID=M5GFT8_DACPD|nr:uncharacterized protein DACRYDRAFT_76875 [Dacryopinax primogenitus]EJU04423.1 hypothetical protein DACRYDRAFT_76875 [Dacryopinax primogenitus]
MYFNAPSSPGPGQQPWGRAPHQVLGGVGIPGAPGSIGVVPPTPSPGTGFIGVPGPGIQPYGQPPPQSSMHHSHHPHQHQHSLPHHQHHASLSQQQAWGSPTNQHTMSGGVAVGMGLQGGAAGTGGGIASMNAQTQLRPQSPGELTKNWQEQLRVGHMCRIASAPHHRARQSAFTQRAVAKSAIPITDPNAPRPPSTNGIAPFPSSSSGQGAALTNGTSGHHQQNSSISSLSSIDPNAKNPPSVSHTPQLQAVNGVNSAALKDNAEGPPAASAKQQDTNPWTTLDMGGMQLKSVSPRLYTFTYLKTLYMNHNRLTTLPPAIGALKQLVHLDLTSNQLITLPPEIGQLTSLKELMLFDNNLTALPDEMGTLHQLEFLGIDGNPLPAEIRQTLQKDGCAAVIAMLRDTAPIPPAPAERPWRDLMLPGDAVDGETFTVVNYNILCERYAPQSLYGYTPAWALRWDYRRQLVLDEITNLNAELVCLQEVDVQTFEEYFVPKLADLGYEGFLWPKSRARTMAKDDARRVDGCAIFYRQEVFQLIEKQLLDFQAIAVQRPDFKKTDDLFTRMLTKDHIGVVALLENRKTGSRLVLANCHLHWDPELRDVKLVQASLLMEEVDKIADRFAKLPPRINVVPESVPLPKGTPSPGPEGDSVSTASASEKVNGMETTETSLTEPSPAASAPSLPSPVKKYLTLPGGLKGMPLGPSYPDGSKIPTIICGDFNSIPDSGVYEFMSSGMVAPDHPDFMTYEYGTFTSKGPKHRLKLRSAYADIPQLTMTNYTPNFEGIIDYIWYSTDTMAVRSVLGEVDPAYLAKSVGFPNAHFPSDHLCLAAEFRLRAAPASSSAPKPKPAFFPNGRNHINRAREQD